MTEVAQLKLFTRREPERLNLHSDYINDVLYSPAIEDPLKTDKRVYDKVNNSLGIRRSTDVVVGHSEDVANIWDDEEERDKEELEKKRVVGNDGDTHSRRREAPASSSTVGAAAAELGSDLDRFVESEFQFLDSDDEGEGCSRSIKEVSHLGTLTKQHQAEVLDPSPSNISAHGPSEFAEEEASSSGLDEPVVASHLTSQPQDNVYDVLIPDLESPPIPVPPPLPPAGILLAVNARSATEHLGVVDGPKTSHQSETINGPETIHGAANARPKDSRPKNEPPSPQNVLFLELQGKLNRRLRKINEDMERNNETDSSISAAAAAAAAVVPIKLTQEQPLHHQTPSHLTPPEQTSTDRDTFLLVAPSQTDEIGITEKIDSAIGHGSETAHIKDSSVMSLKGENMNHPLRESVEPTEIESSAGLLLSDGGAKDLEEDSISHGRELIGRGTMVGLTSQTLHAPDQVEELESQGIAEVQTKHTEVEERLHEVNSRKTVRTLIGDEGPAYPEQLLQPESEGGALHLVTSSPDFIPAPVSDVEAIAKPQSESVRTSSEFIGSLNHPEITTSSVVKRPDKPANGPRPSSSTAIHVWDTPSGDEWTPQMDLMDDEFEDDFPQGIISRRHHQKRLQDNTAAAAAAHQRRPHKRTPSKLYQKKQLGGPQRPAPNPGAFSLARINRAVKKVFGSISSKPSSKQRTPISESVFLQEDGWEIYPSRPYDQSNPGEPIKVVGVEKRPAYAYNAFTRQLVILPDHDRVLVTDDGRRIRDQDQQRSSNGKTSRPTSPGRNTSGNREKPRFTSKSKASSPRPPNLNTKTVKSIHMQGRRESFVEDDSQVVDDAYWRRNSSPNFAGAGAAAVSPTNLSKRKTSTLSKILSFRKSANQSAVSGKKGADQRLTSSDVELMKQGVYKVRHDDPRQG